MKNKLNNNSFFTYPDPNFTVLKKLNLNLENVNHTHILDTFKDKGVNYKFSGYTYNTDMIDNDINFDWKNILLKILTNEFKEGVSYSLNVLGYFIINKNQIKYVTYGKHLLVTKNINYNALCTYIQGQIDLLDLSLESDDYMGLDNMSPQIIFRYREISVLLNVYDKVSNISYNSNYFYKDIENDNNKLKISNKIHDKKILRFLNVIPLTSDFLKYGIFLGYKNINGNLGQMYKFNHEINIFIYNIKDNNYKGIIYKNNFEYVKFEDFLIKDVESKFDLIRCLGKNKIFIKDEKVQFINTILTNNKIKKVKRDLIRDNKYVSFDIECYLDINNQFKPFSCKWYHPKKSKEYLIINYLNWEDMLTTCIIDLFNNFPNHTVYVHNLSSFDSLFLLKIFYKYYNCKVIFKENSAIQIKISKIKTKKEIKQINLVFKDSLMLLPLSLDKLIDAFKLKTKKLNFPYLFVRKLEDINYEGNIPSFNYFIDQLSYEEYIKLASNYNEFNKWNFIKENSKYLHNDVKALYEIIDSFSKEVFDIERINITKIVSISSLALKIFLSNYYDEIKNPIPIPHYNQYKDIKKAYYGGRVEVFKSYGENLYYYDVNSLYPFVMLKNLPMGSVIKSSNPCLDDYFGFCYASVTVPDDINNPILPFRDENNNTYNPTGTWNAWFSSELLKTAVKKDGTLVKIHYGYTFDQGKNIFDEYINKYFTLKKDFYNNTGKRFLSKLMLNSLYGRFGLKHLNSITKIVKSEEAKDITLKYKVIENDIFDKDTGLEYIKYIKEPSDILKELDINSYFNIINEIDKNNDYLIRSIPIAAMITSLATIYMSKFLNIPNNKCYYSDTDSLVLEKPLDPIYIGEDIGKFKFVSKIKRGYFIAPKLYLMVLDNGNKIIKSKGVNNEFLSEDNFINLLYGFHQNIPISRFISDHRNSSISYLKTTLKISPILLKREPKYLNGIIADTKPFKVVNGILIKNNNYKINHSLVIYDNKKYALIKLNSHNNNKL